VLSLVQERNGGKFLSAWSFLWYYWYTRRKCQQHFVPCYACPFAGGSSKNHCDWRGDSTVKSSIWLNLHYTAGKIFVDTCFNSLWISMARTLLSLQIKSDLALSRAGISIGTAFGNRSWIGLKKEVFLLTERLFAKCIDLLDRRWDLAFVRFCLGLQTQSAGLVLASDAATLLILWRTRLSSVWIFRDVIWRRLVWFMIVG